MIENLTYSIAGYYLKVISLNYFVELNVPGKPLYPGYGGHGPLEKE